MSKAWACVKWCWWLGIAYIPYAMYALERRFMQSIGCPPRGDCYVPGSDILLGFDVLVLGSATMLMPVAIWFLVGAPLLALRRMLQHRHPPTPPVSSS
jgi:hypothetical protein